MVQKSMITVALLHKFLYEFRGNNTYIILDRTALKRTLELDYQRSLSRIFFIVLILDFAERLGRTKPNVYWVFAEL